MKTTLLALALALSLLGAAPVAAADDDPPCDPEDLPSCLCQPQSEELWWIFDCIPTIDDP